MASGRTRGTSLRRFGLTTQDGRLLDRLFGRARCFWRGLRRRCAAFRRDLGFADKGGAFFDDEAGGFEVADELGAAFEFAAFVDGDVAVDFAVDAYGFGFDFAADFGVFTDDQRAGRGDFAFDFAVDVEVILELNGALDDDIGGEMIFGGC